LALAEDFDGDGRADVLIYHDDREVVQIYTTAANGSVGITTDLQLTTSLTVPSANDYRVRYQAEIVNAGSQMSADVILRVDLPPGLTPVALLDNCTHDQEALQVICDLGDMA